MSEPNWKEMGFGVYPVTEISHCLLKLNDGVHIAMKIWLPCEEDNIAKRFPFFANEESLKWRNEIYSGNGHCFDVKETFPAIMEYLPYAKDSSVTLSRDHARHSLFCSHGFVDLRVDIRGTGASSGFYFDEYDEQEFEDCVEIIQWISSQPWSNKAIGMYGKSWGGFNGLQVAYKQPDYLKAVISLYSTDNRFSDDIHYQGNTLIGNENLSWSSMMFSFNARPPHPRYFLTIKEWKEFWLKRLQTASQSSLSTWLHHQHRCDPYWQHGSIDVNYDKIKCPVLVIGGQADGYTNAALRMAAMLNESSRGIVGPWAHLWPDTSPAAPNIDFSMVCLNWWKYHLKGDKSSTDVLLWPRLQLYIRDSFKPEEIVGNVPGTWVSLPEWKIMLTKFNTIQPDGNDFNMKFIYFGSNSNLLFQKFESSAAPVELYPHALQGSGCGSFFPIDAGFAADHQSIANKHSQCWMSDILQDEIVFTGFAKVFICIEMKKAGQYCLQVRVCDQFSSGESTYITRGCQNLTLSQDGWVAKKIPKNEKRLICVELNGIAQKINAGHRLLVSITPTYFPSLYPAIDSEGLLMYPAESMIVYQTLTREQLKCTTSFAPPKPLLQLSAEKRKDSHYNVKAERQNGKYTLEINEYGGLVAYPTMQYECETNSIEMYVTDEKVSYGDTCATVTIMSSFDLGARGKVRTLVETNQEMTADKQHFRIKEELKVHINGDEMFSKTWDNVIPRKFV